ncbi:MAG: DUF418 domain-containing protein [Dermabacter sp.]|nr:DUF418 domain-containing protein [Dermabacter sp.]
MTQAPATPAPSSARALLASPVPGTGGRVEALDVLRGIAILGTLASNIWIFTASGGLDADTLIPGWLTEVSSWLPNGKFLGLLTIMFGIGLEIQRQAAIRQGKRWPGGYPVRAGLLFLDGLLNYIFVVQFDVLRAYALTGLIVAFLLLTSERVQWWLIGIFLSIHLTFMTVMAVGGASALPGSDVHLDTLGSDARPGDALAGTVDPGTGYWDEVRMTVQNLGEGFNLTSEFFTIVLMGLGLFLLGANLYRRGIFTPARRRLRLWLIGIGFFVALPLDFFLSQSTFADSVFSGHARYGTAFVVSLGILALVAEFYQYRRPGFIGRQLAAVGTMALTCYLLQNIIGVLVQRNLITPGYLDGVDSTLVTYVSFAVISLILVVFSRLWLSKFSRGPFELAWNWSYRRILGEGRAKKAQVPA